MNLSWHNTDQVRVLLHLTYCYRSYWPLLKFSFEDFYRSYCPLLKLSFPDSSVLSFDILTGNLVYELVFMLYMYRSSSTFVAFDKLSLELLPFAKNFLSFWVSSFLKDNDLKFCGWISIDIIQIKFPLSNFVGVMPLWNLLGREGDLYYFSNSFRMLVRVELQNFIIIHWCFNVWSEICLNGTIFWFIP